MKNFQYSERCGVRATMLMLLARLRWPGGGLSWDLEALIVLDSQSAVRGRSTSPVRDIDVHSSIPTWLGAAMIGKLLRPDIFNLCPVPNVARAWWVSNSELSGGEAVAANRMGRGSRAAVCIRQKNYENKKVYEIVGSTIRLSSTH